MFARIVDANKGGHFSIRPVTHFKPKQYYRPNSNILVSKFLSEGRVGAVTDVMGRRDRAGKLFLPWLIRKVESLHGTVTFRMECAPAFNYCRDAHTAKIVPDDTSYDFGIAKKVRFDSPDLSIDLRWTTDSDGLIDNPELTPTIETLPNRGLLGPAAVAEFTLKEGQVVYFVLRQSAADYDSVVNTEELGHRIEEDKDLGVPTDRIRAACQVLFPADNPILTPEFLEQLLFETDKYWRDWIGKCKYRGRWRESVRRSALVLKMLVYEPTGAIVAAPTFSLPEYIGGTRNWDYRFTWVRDTSFTVYAFIRLGFTDEANAYVNFVLERLKDRNLDGSLQM